MSVQFSVLVARAAAKEPHKPIMTVARELSAQLSAARKIKYERERQARPKLYATKTSWSKSYDNY